MAKRAHWISSSHSGSRGNRSRDRRSSSAGLWCVLVAAGCYLFAGHQGSFAISSDNCLMRGPNSSPNTLLMLGTCSGAYLANSLSAKNRHKQHPIDEIWWIPLGWRIGSNVALPPSTKTKSITLLAWEASD